MELNKMKKRWSWPLACVLLLGFGLLMAGCESDPVAPQDGAPELTEQEAAQRASLVAVSVAKIGPEILKARSLKKSADELGVYPYTFPEGGDVSGTVIMEYFTGGAEGTHSTWNDADYGLLFTEVGEVVDVAVPLPMAPEVTVAFAIDFNLSGPINRLADNAVVSGTGRFIVGSWIEDYTLTSVVVTGINDYPSGGTIEYVSGSHALLVTYDGSDTAMVSVNGVDLYSIDLDTAQITGLINE